MGYSPGNRNGSHYWDQGDRWDPPGEPEAKVTGQQVSFTRSTTQNGSDPSAGSPTETLLRLLLPLDDTV